MPMQLSSLEILEEAQFPQGQARAIARVLEAEFEARREDLVTKSDLREAIANLRSSLEGMMGGLEIKIEGVKAELVRWVFLAVLGLIPIMSGIMYFLLQNAK